MSNHPIGVCTWSLKNNPFDVFQTLEENELNQLHLEVVALELFRSAIDEKRCSVSCTMLAFPQEDYSTLESIRETGGIIPDDCWDVNRELVLDAIRKTAELGVDFLSFHAGFIDHNDKLGYLVFISRIRALAAAADDAGIMLLLETGQESAEELRSFMEDLNHPAIGVNFDPANMILYGKGDPVEAIRVLGPWVKHVHIKDAIASEVPGVWGQEVPWGDGDVDQAGFFQALEEIGYCNTLAIEREAGDARMADIKCAAERLRAI